MASLGEYGSLLALGFGIGIGLSVFRAPMNMMSHSFEKGLNSEIDVLDGIETDVAKQKKRELADIRLVYEQTSRALENIHKPFLIASILAALVNWTLLAMASHEAGYSLSYWQEWAVFFVTGPLFLLISLVLAIVTYRNLSPLQLRLNAIRSS